MKEEKKTPSPGTTPELNENFLERMNKEKLETQKQRADFNIRKFIFVGTLFTIGAAKLPKEIDLILVLYIVPFISFCFDLFILGEDYSIKRIGGFIRTHAPGTLDSNWERWVGKRRDPFGTFAVPLLTLIVLVACMAVLWPKEFKNIGFWIWLILNCAATLFIFFFNQSLRRRLLIDKRNES